MTSKKEIRYQVPESDPVYQKERKEVRDSQNYPVVFAYSASKVYEHNLKDIERIKEENRKLELQLNNLSGRDPELRIAFESRIKSNSEFIQKFQVKKGESLRENFRTLMWDLKMLLVTPGYEERKRFIFDEVASMLPTPELVETMSLDDLWSQLSNDSLPDEFFYALAKRHGEGIAHDKRNLDRIVEETKKEFKIAIIDAVRQGVLPKMAEEALHRIDAVTVNLVDRLISVKSMKLGEIDDYGRILVSNEQLQTPLIPRLKKTLYHEFFHELSGKSATLKTTIDDGPNGMYHRLIHRKSGVSLMAENLWYSPNQWLNEAITEWLALQISGYVGDKEEFAYKGSTSYPEERKELERLFEAGLEKEVLFAAYFENFSSDEPVQGRGKNFAKLLKRINELEGSYGFTKLENRHILREVASQLYENFVFRWNESVSLPPKFPSDAKIFQIDVRIGIKEETVAEQKFGYVAWPIQLKTKTISTEEQREKIEKTFSFLKTIYGTKMKYEISEVRQN